MVSGEMEKGVELSAFAGEAPTVPEHLLPGNVSPDGLNIDYVDGTLRKRAGVARLSRHNALGGGLFVRNAGSDWAARVSSASSISFSGTLHTYECVVCPVFSAVGADFQVWRHVTSGSAGTSLWLKVSGGQYLYEARVTHSGGTLAVSGATAASEVPRVVTVSFDTGTKVLRLQVGGAAASNTDDDDTIGANTYTQPAAGMRFGGESGSDDVVGAVLSDFRIWDGTVAQTMQTTIRALYASEVTSALKAWWRFLQPNGGVDSSGNGESLGAGGLFVGGFVPGVDCFAPLDVVVSGKFYGLWYLVLVATRDTVYQGQLQANTVMSVVARMGNDDPSATTRRGAFRMQALPYRDGVVFLNGHGENRVVTWSTGVQDWLSYEAPVASSAPTVTAAGSGGSLSAGLYQYVFSIYNSLTGVESAIGTFIASQTAVSSDELTINFVSGGFMPDRYFPGADKIRIYRTKAALGVFYFRAEVDIADTVFVDGAADSTLVELMPDRMGYAAPSRFAFELNDALWLGNQAGAESRLVFTDPFTLGAFHSDNYRDIGAGDGDVLTGGIGISDRGLVFKRRSMWLVAGAGSQVQVDPFIVGVGCVQHATIAASHDTLFWMGEGGVYAMGLPLGGAPVSLTGGTWRSFFADFTDADYENCSAVWDAFHERYILSMMLGTVRKVLVYTTRNKAWALWDVDASGFVVLSGGGTNEVFCGWRGYLAQLGSGLNDGGNPHATAHGATGTVTGATSTTLTDSTATWTAITAVANGRLSGLQQVDVTVWDSAGGNEQTRMIIGNTGTVLTVDEVWDVTPAAGWVYHLGAIEGRWRSARLGLQRWDHEQRLERVRVLNVVPAAAEAISFASLDLAWDGGTGTQYVTDSDGGCLFEAGHVGKAFVIDGDAYVVETVLHPNYVTVNLEIGTSTGSTGVLAGADNVDESEVFVVCDDLDEETVVNAAASRYVQAWVGGRGREVVVGVRQTSGDETFDVGAFVLPFVPGTAN